MHRGTGSGDWGHEDSGTSLLCFERYLYVLMIRIEQTHDSAIAYETH